MEKRTKKGTPKRSAKSNYLTPSNQMIPRPSSSAVPSKTPKNKCEKPKGRGRNLYRESFSSSPTSSPEGFRPLQQTPQRSSYQSGRSYPSDRDAFLADIKEVVLDVIKSTSGEVSSPKPLHDLSPDKKRKLQKEVHSVVSQLGEYEEPVKFDLHSSFDSRRNMLVNEKIREICYSNTGEKVQRNTMNRIVKKYFHTLKRDRRLIATKKKASYLIKQRRRQRLINSRNRRRKALKKTKGTFVTEEERGYLEEALETTLYISGEETVTESENSDDDEVPTKRSKTLRKVVIPWRSDFLTTKFRKLDQFSQKWKNLNTGYARKGQVISKREQPTDVPVWAVVSPNKA